MVGDSQLYTATARYSNSSETDVTDQAVWTSSDPSVATVNSGVAIGVSEGNAIITASFGGLVSNGATLIVDPAPAVTLQSIMIGPEVAGIIVGGKQQYAATGTYSDGSTADITNSAIWASSLPSVATINASGLASGIGAGTAYITASIGGITSNSATLTVTAVPNRIASVNVTMVQLMSYRKWWVASAWVTVTEGGIPVAGATIEGVRSGLYDKTASNTTDGFGFITFETNWLRKAGTVTFTVTRVVAPNGQEFILNPPEPSDSMTGPQ